jgi:hypothetical protein
MRLKGAGAFRMCWKIDNAISREGTTPDLIVMNAFGTAARRGSGEGATAHSTTSRCSIKASKNPAVPKASPVLRLTEPTNQSTNMSAALNNHSTRSRHTAIPLRAVHAPLSKNASFSRFPYPHRQPLASGTRNGILPVASYILAHIESHSQPWLWVLVLAALAYSAPTLASWAASWTHKGHGLTAHLKAWGFAILLEGTIVLSHLKALCLYRAWSFWSPSTPLKHSTALDNN